ncbi:hypothetical protein [Bacillus sp. FJAT-45037]|uniref:hypothetical protein n=1 Tax=Bacillus sp. FJAT-45037 TaxID=2011007 RepID=UPI000C232151|nr:hypothetical protein [Bacillus sp. FJAT-45037]
MGYLFSLISATVVFFVLRALPVQMSEKTRGIIVGNGLLLTILFLLVSQSSNWWIALLLVLLLLPLTSYLIMARFLTNQEPVLSTNNTAVSALDSEGAFSTYDDTSRNTMEEERFDSEDIDPVVSEDIYRTTSDEVFAEEPVDEKERILEKGEDEIESMVREEEVPTRKVEEVPILEDLSSIESVEDVERFDEVSLTEQSVSSEELFDEEEPEEIDVVDDEFDFLNRQHLEILDSTDTDSDTLQPDQETDDMNELAERDELLFDLTEEQESENVVTELSQDQPKIESIEMLDLEAEKDDASVNMTELDPHSEQPSHLIDANLEQNVLIDELADITDDKQATEEETSLNEVHTLEHDTKDELEELSDSVLEPTISGDVETIEEDEKELTPAIEKEIPDNMFSLMVEELNWIKENRSEEEFMTMIDSYRQSSLSSKDYYLVSVILRDFYIKKRDAQGVRMLMDELEGKYNQYPILMEEISYYKDLSTQL